MNNCRHACRPALPFLALGILFLGLSPVKAETYKVLLSSDTLQPGQTLRVELDGLSPALHKKAVWRGHSYDFFPVGPNAQRALIGIPLGSAGGDDILNIYSLPHTAAKIPAEEHTVIHISSRSYEIENITLSAKKTVLTHWEHSESAKIHQLARFVSKEQHWEGSFEPPVSGAIEGKFGLKRVHNGTVDAGFHKGVDLKAPGGTPALAANSGVVVLAATYKAHGRVVMIDHGQGVMTIYLHLQSILVRPGQKIAKGHPFGKVGSSGISTAPHIHWQVFVHAVPVDPQQWLETEF